MCQRQWQQQRHAVTDTYGLRPVINVNFTATVTGGNGTSNDNFILEADKTTNVVNKSLKDTVTPGEYVKLNGKTYRVVSKNNDKVKLIYDGYYEEPAGTVFNMAYGTDNVFSTTAGIGQKLNTAVLTYLGTDKIVESNWYQKPFDYGNSYTVSLDETGTPVTSKVGLIRVGEMLSGQSATISSKQHYWTLTPHTHASNAWIVYFDGHSGNNAVTDTNGLRPVINVNSTLTITTGKGTPNSPYEI
ncbi:MAG: hypothetical protein RSB71_03220 [Bacilli bacterium]